MKDSIIKNLMKLDSQLTKEKAEEKADKIITSYEKAHKERNIKRNLEEKKKWEASLQLDNDLFALEHLSDEEIKDYFKKGA